jgi:hypothetical protein
VTLDLSLFGPVGDNDELSPDDGPSAAEYGAFVPASPQRRAALRGAIGFESVISKLVPVRGGLFFERSSAPEVLSTSDVYAPDHIDSVGAALSVGIRANGYDFSVGAITVLGWGQGLALVRSADFEAPARYESTDVRDMVFMVFVGGARNVVKQLVDTFAPR